MLAPLFYAWERRLHARSKDDRTVRPFDWGLDWLCPDGHAAGESPDEIVGRWASSAVADSDSFFAAPQTTDYEWEADPAIRQGSPGTVLFPSHLTTPDAANNVVYGRLFPARRLEGGREDRRRAVLVLPQWNADADGHVGLCQLLARLGINALRLSLPYHDRRMPTGLGRADYIVSSNIVRTVQVCRQAVVDARRAVAWLAAQGYERIGILGTSLGSCLAMLTSAHEPLIRAQALNHVSRYFADPVWEGLSTSHVREGLDGQIALERLRELWMPISPQAYVDRIAGKKTLLVYARYDTTFPVHHSLALVREFDRRQIPYQLSVLPCGHYTTGIAPFKYLDGYVLTRFLARNL
jgi:pimeloyl-ACP methyl ester carboxylesterase